VRFVLSGQDMSVLINAAANTVARVREYKVK